MTKNNLIVKIMIQSARKAGKILKLAFESSSSKEVNKGKGNYDVFSKADTDSENIIIKILTSKLPKISILSEERGFIDRKSSDTIIIDPLDGSSNFLLGIPHFSVSLVYISGGEIVSSVVYNPILDKMYFAEKENGAFLNSKKLKIQTKRDSSYITVNFSHNTKWKEKRKFFDWAYKSGFSRVMNNWSPNLDFCLLAESKVDAVVSLGSLIYDFAPGYLIAKESGCIEFPSIKKIKVTADGTKQFVIANKKSLLAKIQVMV
ncbi:MAG: inositol monophosphatase [Candidatus Paceibacterota bacterium]|jgi:myo-inositol-1(or 4)-monophosphatase